MQIDLNGMWKLTADLGQQSRAGKPGYEPAGWLNAPVPGHWPQVMGLDPQADRVLYRKSFTLDDGPQPGDWARLNFDGICYAAKVWVNGAFVGEHQGYFEPAQFDVTKHLRTGENVVLVELEAPGEQAIMGSLGGGRTTAGIWREVRLELGHGVAPGALEVRPVLDQLPTDDAPGAGSVSFDLELSATAEATIEWTASLTPETFAGEPVTVSGSRSVRRGTAHLRGAITIDDPRLWWTWDHGRPDLYRFTLEMRTDGQAPRRFEQIVGFRQVQMRKGHLWLNGRRIFLRGTSYAAPEPGMAGVKSETYQRDVELIAHVNANTIRVYGHIAKPALYEEASRRGLLVWQDFPLVGQQNRAVLNEAKRQARAMVALLGPWPAVAIWCGYTEPIRPEGEGFFAKVFGSWSRSTLGPAIKSEVHEIDPTRPSLAHPGEWGHAHYLGWHSGKIEDLERLLNRSPGQARFVPEFGAQAFPNPEHSRRFVRGQWPAINWDALAEQHLLQTHVLERQIPHSLAANFEAYVGLTQEHQARLLKYYIEQFRRRKYHPGGGALQYLFADPAPGAGFGMVDFWRAPKASYDAVSAAFRPVHIMAESPRTGYAPGAKLALKAFVVNDRHEALSGTWSWALERNGQRLAGETHPVELPPDSVQTLAQPIVWDLPEGLAPGPVELVLTVDIPGIPDGNRYNLNILS